MLARAVGGDGILLGTVIAALAYAVRLIARLAFVEAAAMLRHDVTKLTGQADRWRPCA